MKTYRKPFRIFFWVAFIFMIVFCILALRKALRYENKLEDVKKDLALQLEVYDKKDEEQKNEINTDGAKSIAKEFVTNYYMWSFEEDRIEKRKELLAPYLWSGVDETAGLDILNCPYSCSVKSVSIWDVKIDGEKCDITVKVETILTEKVITKVQEDGKEVEKQEEKKSTKTEFMVIPLVIGGDSFKVRSNPYCVTVPSYVEGEQTEEKETETNNTALITKVTELNNAFLKVLTTGTQEELNYYTVSGNIESLKDIYEFVEVTKFKVYKTDDDAVIKVVSNVVFTNASLCNVSLKITCMVSMQDSRYLIKDIEY